MTFSLKGLNIFCYSNECMFCNSYHAMGKFSRQQTDDIFLIFPRKYRI